jgi:hypothetical protein
MSLADAAARAEVVARLGQLYAGRKVILGPGVLAAYPTTVTRLTELGCDVLVLSTNRGAGPIPEPGSCEVVELDVPTTASVTEELRLLQHLTHHLPPHAVAAIEAFDPACEALWNLGQFVSNDAPVLGRELVGGRPSAFLAIEDKILAEQIWAACDLPVAPHRVVPVDAGALAAATSELANRCGAVWSGDARDGFNGAGNYVRWVVDETDAVRARGFFLPRCDRVRVMPFLDGVPCSIHGFVLPDGTAALRPVEIGMLRHVEKRRFVYGGLSTYWDPRPEDREEMRGHVKRVGEHLRAAYSYRGAFGIDGVMTADGFRPTELNPRMPAGLTTLGSVDRELFDLLQTHLVMGLETGVTVADVESLLPLLDAGRAGRAVAVGEGVKVGGPDDYPVAWDGTTLTRATEDTGTRLVLSDTPSGFFCKLDPCAALSPGDRLGPLNAALMHFLDAEYGTEFGAVEAAPDLR